MRALIALGCWLVLGSLSTAQEPPRFADATLRAVQFVDEIEGWAVGDDGVILHTIDGGQTWDRQPSGTRASLGGVHFVDNFTGFAVGRESLPFGRGSVGVILHTEDGGAKWHCILQHETPGLHAVHFVDKRHGMVVGMGSDHQPSGVFTTADAGATWKLVPGPRQPGWCGGAMLQADTGVVCGPWGNVAFLEREILHPAQLPELQGQTIRDLRSGQQQVWAVGDAGLILVSRGTGGKSWERITPSLPENLLQRWDLSSVQVQGSNIWAVGRPGSLVLHSPDAGRTWQTFPTGQALPLQALYFRDEKNGWAVGALGTILATNDGGRNWKVQRRGGHRTAVMVISSTPDQAPLGTIAALGGDEGYLVTALRVTCPDPASAAPTLAGEETRWHDAVRNAGGSATDMFAGFSLPQHLAYADGPTMVRWWGQGDKAKGMAALQQRIVLAIRMWQPDVILTDAGDTQLGGVLGQVIEKACTLAGEADAYPEMQTHFGLSPYAPKKLYVRCKTAEGAHVHVDLASVRPHLLNTAADHTSVARTLVNDTPVTPESTEHFRLAWSSIPQAEQHRAVMEGVFLGHGGQARREQGLADPDKFEARQKVVQSRRNLQAIAKQFVTDPTKARQMLGQLEKDLVALDDNMAAEALFLLAHENIQAGQWLIAREVFFILLDRFPTHRLSPEACRWLIAFSGSSEAKRREELGHFQAPLVYGFSTPVDPAGGVGALQRAGLENRRKTVLTRRKGEVRLAYQASVALADVMAVYGAMRYSEPAVQFCVQASLRQLGQRDKANLWYTQFQLKQTAGPWYDAARSEIWLMNREGPPPKPVAQVFKAAKPPYLDGRFDDPCWQQAISLPMHSAVGHTTAAHPTEVKISYDDQFLYLAVTCKRPAGQPRQNAGERQRDGNLDAFDRISLLLDLDRDYTTYFHLQADECGHVREECWHDLTWNPKWYVKVTTTDTGWHLEASIPLAELTGKPVEPGRVWAFNLVRTIPGKGVQAFSIPADVQPRPEGFGLLQFMGVEKPPTQEKNP